MFAAAMAMIAHGGCRPADQAQPPPPPAVTVAHPVLHSVIEWDEYTGRLDAVELVEVRARVGGLIMSMPFQEGSLVAAGDLLVEIDERPFQAELDARKGAADEAEAQVQLATIEYRRVESIPKEARSPTELDTATAMLKRTEAVLAGANAQIESARLNVEWCRVTAPIGGRVSRRLVTVGNLISGGTGQGTLLTTITSVDPIYCYIDADERSVLKYADMARSGARVSARQSRIPCEMELSDETGYPHVGEVDFVDNRVDPATGTVRGRGIFPNTDGWLLPGLFARVRVPGSGRYDALLVPDAAVTTDQNEKLLFIVDDQSVVQARPVKLGALFGELRAITSGINREDRVVIVGLMHARPGSTVSPVEGEFSLASLPPEPSDVSQSQPTSQISLPTTAPQGNPP